MWLQNMFYFFTSKLNNRMDKDRRKIVKKTQAMETNYQIASGFHAKTDNLRKVAHGLL